MTSLTPLFFPRSVAIIGASDDPKRIGGRLLANLTKGRFEGSIYPVNPNRETVQGAKAYSSIEEVPETVDLVALAVGGVEGLNQVRACSELGVGGVIVFASEIGASSGELSEQLAAGLLSRSPTRILGPNSNGVINPAIGLFASFTSMLDRGLPSAGSIAVATQSAGVGASYTLEYLRRQALGIRYWCHVGAEADVGLDELLNFYASDPEIRSVAINFETPLQPRKFVSALASLRSAGKYVAGFHAGSSVAGQAAAATHTGVLTSVRPRVLLGVAAQQGMQRMKSLRRLCNALEAQSYLVHEMHGLRLAIITSSGGVGVSLADALAEVEDVSLPALNVQLQEEVRRIAPFASPGNPVDLTAQVINRPELISQVLGAIEDAGSGFDGVVVYLPSGKLGDVVADAVANRPQRGDAERVVIAVGLASDAARATLHRANVPVFDEPDDLREALASWFAGQAAMETASRAAPRLGSESAERARRAVRGLRHNAVPALGGSGATLVLDEESSKTCLALAGLDVPRSSRVESPDDVARAAEELGFPLVMKLLSPGVSHKAARGHVRLPIRDLRSAVDAAVELLAARDEDGGVVVVEQMMLGIAEVFVGVHRDEEFGALVVIARGGVSVESPESMATVCALPATRADVSRMLKSIDLPLPTGPAGERARAEITRLVDTLDDLLAAGEAEGLDAVDVNPVVVGRDGSCVLVDALLSFT